MNESTLSIYINNKLLEYKNNIQTFINDDYETKKYKVKQYIYINRKLFIYGTIIAILLAYISHLEETCHIKHYTQFGGDDSPVSVPTPVPTPIPTPTPVTAPDTAPVVKTTSSNSSKKGEGVNAGNQGVSQGKTQGQPQGIQEKEKGGNKTKEQGKKGKLNMKQFNIGGILSKSFGKLKNVFNFFLNRLKFIMNMFITLFLIALAFIAPIVLFMAFVYYMIKFLLKRQTEGL